MLRKEFLKNTALTLWKETFSNGNPNCNFFISLLDTKKENKNEKI